MRDRNADERGDVFAEPARVDRSVIAGDNSAVFKLLDALIDRGRREPDLVAKFDQSDTPMLLQEVDYLQVDSVEFGGVSAEFHKVILVGRR
jgi:hypothetical protein